MHILKKLSCTFGYTHIQMNCLHGAYMELMAQKGFLLTWATTKFPVRMMHRMCWNGEKLYKYECSLYVLFQFPISFLCMDKFNLAHLQMSHYYSHWARFHWAPSHAPAQALQHWCLILEWVVCVFLKENLAFIIHFKANLIILTYLEKSVKWERIKKKEPWECRL